MYISNWASLVSTSTPGTVVQSLSHVQLPAIPCTAARQASLSFNHLLEFSQTHVYQVGDAI